MTRSLVQNRDQIFVKGCGYLSFAKNMGRNIGRDISENLSRKYIETRLDNAKQSAIDASKKSSS